MKLEYSENNSGIKITAANMMIAGNIKRSHGGNFLRDHDLGFSKISIGGAAKLPPLFFLGYLVSRRRFPASSHQLRPKHLEVPRQRFYHPI